MSNKTKENKKPTNFLEKTKEKIAENLNYDFLSFENNILIFTCEDYKFICNFNNLAYNCNYSLNLIIEKKGCVDNCSFLILLLIGENNSIDTDFSSLYINYRESSYAFKGFNFKKEKMNDREILISRFIDKCIRPFINNFSYKAIEINIFLLKYANWADCDLFATTGTLLLLKHILPIKAGIGRLVISLKDEMTYFFTKDSLVKTNLLICANLTSIFAIEMESACLSQSTLESYFKIILNGIKSFEKIINKISTNSSFVLKKHNLIDLDEFEKINNLNGEFETNRQSINKHFIENNRRFSHRKHDEIRNISINFDPYLPNVVNFSRGKTSIMCICNLNVNFVNENKTEANYKDNLSKINLNVNYNFYSFATGKIERKFSTRRETGHGKLIAKSFESINNYYNYFPCLEDISIHSICEVLSCDGSTSMASVCALSILLKKLGFQNSLVGGISLGLFHYNNKYEIITDICGEEDKYSEMDFKITGTKDIKNKIKFASIHLDTKSNGFPVKLLKEFFIKAEKALLHVIEKMELITNNFNNMILIEKINKSSMGLFIGQNGSNIKNISKFTKSKIYTRQDGYLFINSDKDNINSNLNPTYMINLYKDNLPKNSIVSFVSKEDFDTKENKPLISNVGNITLTKNTKGKKGLLISVKVQDWQTKTGIIKSIDNIVI